MKQRYFIRELALTELEEIWLYTLSEWDLEQADAYTSSILARMNWLADNPDTAKPRKDIKPGYFRFPVGRHLSF